MINRRDLLVLLGAAAVAPRAVLAQPTQKPRLLGWLNTGSRGTHGHFHAAFKEGLAALGWKEGTQYVMDERWADNQMDRLPALAEQLAARQPAVIIAAPNQAVQAALKWAPATPIVMATGVDPVASGFAVSLARPGRTITGLTNIQTDVSAKFLELLLAAAPKVKRVGFLLGSTNVLRAQHMENARRIAAKHAVDARFAEVATLAEIEAAISRFAKEGVEALVVMPGALFTGERRRIAQLSLERRWPAISGSREFAESGTLLSYGLDISDNYRRAAHFVDRILKGAKPGDLPIEQPTKVELVVNLRTAKALKLEIPRELAVRADKVIE